MERSALRLFIQELISSPLNLQDIIRSENILITIGQIVVSQKDININQRYAKRSNATLIIIGNGPDREEYISRIVDAGLEDKVFVYTEATDDERDMLLARATLFLFAAIRRAIWNGCIGSDECRSSCNCC